MDVTVLEGQERQHSLRGRRHLESVAAVAEYSPSFDALVPNGFVKVATWNLLDAPDPRWQAIVFWAPDQPAAAALRADMRAFSPALQPQHHVAVVISG